jgi:hypothetical protein
MLLLFTRLMNEIGMNVLKKKKEQINALKLGMKLEI